MKSSDVAEPMSIGELAARFGLATHVLRHGESVGLLSPERDAAGRRRYRRADLYRVAVVLRAKEAGLSLDAVKEMFTAPDPTAWRAVLERQRDELRGIVDRAQASLDLVECALDCDHDDIATCPHFQAFVEARAGGPGVFTAI